MLSCVLTQPNRDVFAGDTLKKLENEIIGFLDTSKVAVVTVTSSFSQEIVEQESSLLSLFKTELEPKKITYKNIGSGFIFDRQGHVITRSSIVLGSDENTVTLANGREYPATFVGHDAETGFAVLKIEAPDLRPARLGDSEAVAPGSWIVVIGNSLGVYPSVVFGAVSGLRRDGILQVSAILDPGNNGSPIFNTDGEVIGVVAARLNTTDGVYESFNGRMSQTVLAFPINWVKSIAKGLIEHGYVRKGWLGIVAKQDGAELRVGKVVKGSPAERSGLAEGDIIVRFAGKAVTDLTELVRLVRYTAPDSLVTIEYLRDDSLKAAEVRVGEKVAPYEPVRRYSAQPVTSSQEWLSREVRSEWPNYQQGWIDETRLLKNRIEILEKEIADLKKRMNAN